MEASRNLLKSQHGKDPRRSHVHVGPISIPLRPRWDGSGRKKNWCSRLCCVSVGVASGQSLGGGSLRSGIAAPLPSFHHCASAPHVSLLGAILPGGSSHSSLASVPGGIPADKIVWEHTAFYGHHMNHLLCPSVPLQCTHHLLEALCGSQSSLT